MNERTNGGMYEQTQACEQMNWQINKWTDGQMNELMNGQTNKQAKKGRKENTKGNEGIKNEWWKQQLNEKLKNT